VPGRPSNEPTNYWAFGFQSAKDTDATTFQFLRHLDGTANEVNEDVESVREGGDGQEVGLRYKTAVSMDGQAVCNFRPEVGHRLITAALGADIAVASTAGQGAASTASGVAHDHLAVPTSQIPYITVEQYWADQVERITNCQITGLDIEFEAGRPLKLTPQFIGGGTPVRKPAASALTPSRETNPPFMYPGASVVLVVGGGASGAISKVTKGKISIKRGVDDGIHTTALTRDDVVAQNFDVDADFTALFESATSYYNPIHWGTGSVIPVDLATGSLRLTTVIGAGTLARVLEIGVNQLHYTGARVNKLDPDGKTMYLDVAGMGFKGATYQVYSKTTIASAAAVV
jgi:hypothetical protein